MAVFKCKMCGGALEVSEGMTVCECEYCGTQQTLPKTDNEQNLNMFNRANHFRQQCEFDKAAEIYEKMAARSEGDAELYWSIVLCRYGIEYVDDPLTKKKIATCHRTQFKSILNDPDYLSALEHADTMQRSVYEREAAYIDKVQKGILEISNKEQPFDVFICYKETDENGRRTPDSVLAQELYYGLTQEGFKVFFSRITLESKLGTEYEPYIFAALNSAKVMVVVGTKPEYFNAVWVRNEWSRYLMLMQEDRSRTLIPAYKDMDPYDLPDALSMFQAQDMSKLGFMQDLIRGIKKIVQKEPEQPVVKTVIQQAVPANANITPLLKRAALFLEDRDWNSAQEYCEKVLDQDPENAQAYLYKLMAELQVSKQEDLQNCPQPFDGYDNFRKAVRFGDDGLKSTLNGYISQINARNEEARLNELYNAAKLKMDRAVSLIDYAKAEREFRNIQNYRDAAVLADECLKKGEDARKNAIYQDAKALLQEDTVESVQAAIAKMREVPEWLDSAALISDAETHLEELKQARAAAEAEAEKKRMEKEAERKRKAAKIKRIAVICGSAAVLAIAAIITVPKIIKSSKYNKAVEMFENGQYEEAKNAFTELGEYKDAADKAKAAYSAEINEPLYQEGIALMNSGKYEEARRKFANLVDYKDSRELKLECDYQMALELESEGRNTEVLEIYEALGNKDYKDSQERYEKVLELCYQEALELFNTDQYEKASELFEQLGTYRGSESHLKICLKNIEIEDIIETTFSAEVIFNTSMTDTNNPITSISINEIRDAVVHFIIHADNSDVGSQLHYSLQFENNTDLNREHKMSGTWQNEDQTRKSICPDIIRIYELKELHVPDTLLIRLFDEYDRLIGEGTLQITN